MEGIVPFLRFFSHRTTKLRRRLPLTAALSLTLLASTVCEAQPSCVRTFILKDDVSLAIKSFYYYIREGQLSGNLIAGRPPIGHSGQEPITLEGHGPFRFVAVLSGDRVVVGAVGDLCQLTKIIIVYDANDQPVMNLQ
jgi:hypothetical protein